MKIGELDMHCGNCNIIDYCNTPEDTPPCAQTRFKDVATDDFIMLAESSKCKGKNAIINHVHKRLLKAGE